MMIIISSSITININIISLMIIIVINIIISIIISIININIISLLIIITQQLGHRATAGQEVGDARMVKQSCASPNIP